MAVVNKTLETFMVVLIIFNLVLLSVAQECANHGESCAALPCCNPETSICDGESQTCGPAVDLYGNDCGGEGAPCDPDYEECCKCCDALACADWGKCVYPGR